MCCGLEKPESQFFRSNSKLWAQTDHTVLFCKDCVTKHFENLKTRYKSEEIALKAICGIMDWPYNPGVYQNVIEGSVEFSVGVYARQLQMRQYRGKVFVHSLVEGELDKKQDEVRTEKEARWSKKDRQNMNYALSVVGYDPFDGSMTADDRRYCFNILAGYCDSEGIREGGHKRQAAIQMTQLHLQCRKLDDMINEELLRGSPDESRIKTLSETKQKFINSISSLAKDNNLASSYNNSSKAGRNTFSSKMKEIADAGIEQIRVNLFDIETSAAMRQVADISNQSILEQLSFQASDYADMVKEQRSMLRDANDKLDQLEEENRMLKNKVIDLEANAAKKR